MGFPLVAELAKYGVKTAAFFGSIVDGEEKYSSILIEEESLDSFWIDEESVSLYFKKNMEGASGSGSVIDENMRPLCEALAALGVVTRYSCAGHTDLNYRAYVSFNVSSIKYLFIREKQISIAFLKAANGSK
jgi:hypothetical protein